MCKHIDRYINTAKSFCLFDYHQPCPRQSYWKSGLTQLIYFNTWAPGLRNLVRMVCTLKLCCISGRKLYAFAGDSGGHWEKKFHTNVCLILNVNRDGTVWISRLNCVRFSIYLIAGGAVGWGTGLQAGRSRVRFLMLPLEFFIDIILPAALWPWVWLSL